jgi:transglutaminase-like putative cysteine protease
MYYLIRHVTNYRYSSPICESQMEVRMRPRTDGAQRTWDFRLTTNPRSKISSYRDNLGNTIHHFDIPARHDRLSIVMEALVEMNDPPAMPTRLGEESWSQLENLAETDALWEMLQPSRFTKPTERLRGFAQEFGLLRGANPISTISAIQTAIHRGFHYEPQTTRVDSPIDEALSRRQGVCQDFAHIFITLARGFGVPCRYVSGYLFHRQDSDERSAPDASHAWVEVYLPDVGWVGLDPTNDLHAGDRHIRVAVGRDYGDVPPTRGVFKGEAQTETELRVGVRVAPSAAPLPQEAIESVAWTPLSREQAAQQQQ